MSRSQFARTIGLGMTIAALGVSTAGAQPGDLRSPDAVAAGQQTTQQSPRSDVRTPDARDYGEGRGTFSAPEVTVVKVAAPVSSTGFDWGDAGIGAGGLLGLVLIALGGTAAVSHHRHTQRRTPSII